jgi:hypothetical protein
MTSLKNELIGLASRGDTVAMDILDGHDIHATRPAPRAAAPRASAAELARFGGAFTVAGQVAGFQRDRIQGDPKVDATVVAWGCTTDGRSCASVTLTWDGQVWTAGPVVTSAW